MTFTRVAKGPIFLCVVVLTRSVWLSWSWTWLGPLLKTLTGRPRLVFVPRSLGNLPSSSLGLQGGLLVSALYVKVALHCRP